jgi:hypothetical protein
MSVHFCEPGWFVKHKVTGYEFPVVAFKEVGLMLIPFVADGKSNTPVLVDLDNWWVGSHVHDLRPTAPVKSPEQQTCSVHNLGFTGLCPFCG